MLISYPAFLETGAGFGLFAVRTTTSLTLLIAVWTLIGTKRSFAIGLFLAGTALILTLGELFFRSALLSYAKILVAFLFFILTLAISFRNVVFGDQINGNRLIGAICIYFLIGILWSLAYTVINLAAPGSFNGLSTLSLDHQESDLIYFSFVTLATLGYGDIAPTRPLARSLAYFEAIIGQFFLAILVAGLVAAYIGRKKTIRSDEHEPSDTASTVIGRGD